MSIWRKVVVWALFIATVVGLGGNAFGEAVWTTGSHTPSQWTVDPRNLLGHALRTGKINSLDNQVMDAANISGYGNVGNGLVLSWAFSTPVNVEKIVAWTSANNGGRDGICIESVDVIYKGQSEWTALGLPRVEYGTLNVDKNNSSAGNLFASCADESGANLAEGISAIRLNFGNQDNDKSVYGEIEVIGDFAERGVVWDRGRYTPSTWTMNPSNMMVNVSSHTGIANFINRTMENSNNRLSDYTTVTWNYAVEFDLYQFCLYTWWNDGGLDGFNITKVEAQKADSTWVTLADSEAGSGMEYGTEAQDGTRSSPGALFGRLRMSDDSALAKGVKALRLTVGKGDNNGFHVVSEIEALGYKPPTCAVIDVDGIRTSVDCWRVDWSAGLSDVGAGDGVDLNLWTSLDGETYTLAQTRRVTEKLAPAAFSQAFESLNQTVYYRFEAVNTDGETTWKVTNAVASVKTVNNATFYWRPGVSGLWEDAANWSNSWNDARLTYPDGSQTTASFALCGEGGPVTVTVGANHTPIWTWGPLSADVTIAGASSVSLAPYPATCAINGTNTISGLQFKLPLAYNSRSSGIENGAVLRFVNGATGRRHSQDAHFYGIGSRIEVHEGASFAIDRGGLSSDMTFVVDDATMTVDSTFTYSPLDGCGPHVGSNTNGHFIIRGASPLYRDTYGHAVKYATVTPLEFRFEPPKKGWTDAPCQFGNGHTGTSGSGFGTGNARWLVNVTGDELTAGHEIEIPLVKVIDTDTDAIITTNKLDFVAFGTPLKVGQPLPRKGDYFYYTYNLSTSRTPQAEGDKPTGIWYHFNGRKGFCLFVR